MRLGIWALKMSMGGIFLQAHGHSESSTVGNFLFGCRNAHGSGSGTHVTLGRTFHSPSWLIAVWQKAPQIRREGGLGWRGQCWAWYRHWAASIPSQDGWRNVSRAHPDPPGRSQARRLTLPGPSSACLVAYRSNKTTLNSSAVSPGTDLPPSP